MLRSTYIFLIYSLLSLPSFLGCLFKIVSTNGLGYNEAERYLHIFSVYICDSESNIWSKAELDIYRV